MFVLHLYVKSFKWLVKHGLTFHHFLVYRPADAVTGCVISIVTHRALLTLLHTETHRDLVLLFFEVLQRFADFMQGASPPAYRSLVIMERKTSSMPDASVSLIILTHSLGLICSWCK